MKNRIVWTSALFASSLGMLVTGCKSNVPAPGEAPIVDGSAASTDPSAANLAPGTQVAGSSYAAPQQVSTQTYPKQAAPAPNYGTGNSQQNEAYQYNTQAPANGQYNTQPSTNGQYSGDPQANAAEYDQYASLLDPNVPPADQAPPPLPDNYDQPEAPGPDYLWTPGYWDYASAGYYYVPGVWVGSPYVGALWTPGWWGFGGGHYRFHRGYWGPHVGYYGGINYGFGYVGHGYQGGYWNNDHFRYNTAVLHVNPRYVNNNVYQHNVTVINNTYINNSRTSYVGGNGGLRRGPDPQELAALHEQHVGPMQSQMQNRQAAAQNRQQFFAENKGRPQAVFAAHPLPADHNIQAPPRTTAQEGFANGARPGENRPMIENRPGSPINGNPQQRQQLEQQQRVQQQQQANVQREQQHNQQLQVQNQQRAQEQQRNQQQQQVQNQQRAQQDQQRVQQQQNAQREQQMNVQRQQKPMQPQARPAAPAPHVEAQRPAPAPQPQRVEAPRPAPQPQHVEAARPAPAPAARPAQAPAAHAAPPPAPHPAPAGGGEHHH